MTGHSTPQQPYQPQAAAYQAGYNPGAHSAGPQPFPGYPAAAGGPAAQQWNKNNGNRNPPGHSNNWETSSQHSNSSQKKFSSSSGSSETSLSLTSSVTPRLVQQQLAGGYPAQFRHEAPYYHQPRPGLENIQSKEFVPTKRGRGGRGGSSRGRDEMSGYSANPRPGHQVRRRLTVESFVITLYCRPESPRSAMPLMSTISPDNTTTSYQVH